MSTDMARVAVHLSQSEIAQLESMPGGPEENVARAIQEYDAQPPPAMQSFRVSEGPLTTFRVEIPASLKRRLDRKHWRPCYDAAVSEFLRKHRIKAALQKAPQASPPQGSAEASLEAYASGGG